MRPRSGETEQNAEVVESKPEELQLRKTSEGPGAEVERLIAPGLRDLGYEIVRVSFGGDHRPRLQLMIERLDGGPIDVEDCASASRCAAAILDVEDPIPSAYVLEVSSPGIDRPLTRLSDFQRYAGHLVRLELSIPKEGRRRFSGTLLGIEDEAILLDCEEGVQHLAFRDLAKAKLVLTDELIAAHQAEEEAARAAGPDDAAEDSDLENEAPTGAGGKGMKGNG